MLAVREPAMPGDMGSRSRKWTRKRPWLNFLQAGPPPPILTSSPSLVKHKEMWYALLRHNDNVCLLMRANKEHIGLTRY